MFAYQGLPLRGHEDGEGSNFTQLLLLRSIGCPDILTWMKKKKPQKYTPGDIQNEFLQVMAYTFCRTSAQILSRMVSILSWLMSALMCLIKSSL